MEMPFRAFRVVPAKEAIGQQMADVCSPAMEPLAASDALSSQLARSGLACDVAHRLKSSDRSGQSVSPGSRNRGDSARNCSGSPGRAALAFCAAAQPFYVMRRVAFLIPSFAGPSSNQPSSARLCRASRPRRA
eukprot:scaffold47_cov258-Pinguiococcus_pyrenoidosus.AAC.124